MIIILQADEDLIYLKHFQTTKVFGFLFAEMVLMETIYFEMK